MSDTPCPRCGKPQPPDSVHTCSPRRPDARPVGETTEQAAAHDAFRWLDHVVLTLVQDQRGLVPARKRPDWELYRVALDAYREAVAADARAALLRDAPAVWVATPNRRSSHARWERWIFTHAPSEPVAGEFVGIGVLAPDELAATLPVPPGTCVRYRLVPDPEEPHA